MFQEKSSILPLTTAIFPPQSSQEIKFFRNKQFVYSHSLKLGGSEQGLKNDLLPKHTY